MPFSFPSPFSRAASPHASGRSPRKFPRCWCQSLASHSSPTNSPCSAAKASPEPSFASGISVRWCRRNSATVQRTVCNWEYSFDGPKLLGTGGALRQALPKLGERFFVLYGDSYLPIPFAPVAETFERSGKPGLMTVYENEGLYDTSNVVFANGEIVVYDKKRKLPEMRHIDYGLSLFKASVIEAWPADQAFDLADVMTRLVATKQLAGFEVRERFYEIGSHAGLAELEQLLGSQRW